MHDYLEMLRSKPEEVRARIALLSSGAVTGIIALGWVVATATSGSFSLTPQVTSNTVSFGDGQAALDTLAGAAGALQGTAAISGLVIVEEETSSTIKEEEPEATVLPF